MSTLQPSVRAAPDSNPGPEPIDAVITWVDGSDPAHAERLATYLAGIGGARPQAAHPTRFNDAGELEYCLTSIFRFAPWIRRIHLVTDRQRPALLDRLQGTAWSGRVKLVDHRDIFRGHEAVLPTFNSRAIISMLWRIPDLAERWLYFNDDFVLLQPIAPTDFFRDGQVVLRGRWMRQRAHRPLRRAVDAVRRLVRRDEGGGRVRNLAAQELSARLAGFERDYLRLEHLPFPQRVGTMADFFAAHPELLAHNIGFRLRSGDQFKAEALAIHLEARQGKAVFDARLRTAQLKPSEQWFPRLRRKIARADRDPRFAFACVQSLELAPPAVQSCIRSWLDRRVGRLDQLLGSDQAP